MPKSSPCFSASASSSRSGWVRAGATAARGVSRHGGGAIEERRRHLTPFQSFMMALAASISTGNIAGVATAIISGGPGALFGSGSTASSLRHQVFGGGARRGFRAPVTRRFPGRCLPARRAQVAGARVDLRVRRRRRRATTTPFTQPNSIDRAQHGVRVETWIRHHHAVLTWACHRRREVIGVAQRLAPLKSRSISSAADRSSGTQRRSSRAVHRRPRSVLDACRGRHCRRRRVMMAHATASRAVSTRTSATARPVAYGTARAIGQWQRVSPR